MTKCFCQQAYKKDRVTFLTSGDFGNQNGKELWDTCQQWFMVSNQEYALWIGPPLIAVLVVNTIGLFFTIVTRYFLHR